jgi:GrpB-like predicted nucleotidyltransferase (UPF0157 family)
MRPLRIDHIGSTAVPALAAKPVIDIQISVAALDRVGSFCEPLRQLGYGPLRCRSGGLHSQWMALSTG